MRKATRVIGAMFALALLWLGLVLSEWLPRPTEAERAAIAALEPQPANVAGRHDAFAAAWLFAFDVPDAELEAVAAADVAAVAARMHEPGSDVPFASAAEARYPRIPQPANDDPALCPLWGSGCLQRIRANVEATRARLQTLAPLLAKHASLARYDHYRNRFEPRIDAPLGTSVGGMSAPLTAAALTYVDGDVDGAFAALCRDTATWRRLRTHADTLIVDMLGVAQMSNAIGLYAEMLAEQPPGFAPPCPDTFAPLSDTELDQCAVMRGEYLTMRNTMLQLPGRDPLQTGDRGHDLLLTLLNRRHAAAIPAPVAGRYCMDAHRQRARQRDSAALPEPPGCGVTAWMFDPFGCSMMVGLTPDYDDYYHRLLDLDGRLRLLQSAVWLRAQAADGDRAAQFAARPAALRSDHHAPELDAAAGVLRMRNLVTNRGQHWELPYRASAPAAAADRALLHQPDLQ